MKRVVLDASVAVAWFVAEDESITRATAAVLEDIVEGRVRPLVPELFWYELLAVLVRRTPAAPAAGDAVGRLTDLGFERIVLDPALASRAEELARRHRVTGYDAVYAALAESTHTEWWTLDREAHSRLASLRVSRLVAG